MRSGAGRSERQELAYERLPSRRELEALQRAVRQHLQRSGAVPVLADAKLQAELAALTGDLMGILMRLDLELAAPSLMQ